MPEMINLDWSLQSEEVGGRLEFNTDVIINAAFYFLVDIHPGRVLLCPFKLSRSHRLQLVNSRKHTEPFRQCKQACEGLARTLGLTLTHTHTWGNTGFQIEA